MKSLSNTSPLLLLLTGVLLPFLFTSCEKVVEIDINEGNPQIVVEGILANDANDSGIKLSKSGSFYGDNNFEKISGASVSLEDGLGNTQMLSEVTAGEYSLPNLAGTPGQTYTLKVESEGTEISAVSTMPTAVSLDSLLVIDRRAVFGIEGFGIQVGITDPAGEENYYRFRIYRNNELVAGYTLYDDALFDGTETQLPLFPATFDRGDSVDVEMFCIDRATYVYFTGLQNSSGQGLNSSVPGNPDSNLNGEAIGYFGAVVGSRRSVRIP